MHNITQLTLTTQDGHRLAAVAYEPDAAPVASVVILGAYAVRQRYYRRFAAWLADRGYLVLTFDYRGIGDSLHVPIRQMTATATDWATHDVSAALRWLGERPGPRLAIGHSFGGQVVGINDDMVALDGLYMVGAQVAWHGTYDGLARARMWSVTHIVMPSLSVAFGYLPGWSGIGEDVPKGAADEWARWLRSPNYLVDHVDGAARRYHRFSGPSFSLGFTDDPLAPPRGVRALAAYLDPEHTDLQIVQPSHFGLSSVGHFGYFKQHDGDVMWLHALERFTEWRTSAAARPSTQPSSPRHAEPNQCPP